MDTLLVTGLKVVATLIYGGIQIVYGSNHLVRMQGLGIVAAGAAWILSGM